MLIDYFPVLAATIGKGLNNLLMAYTKENSKCFMQNLVSETKIYIHGKKIRKLLPPTVECVLKMAAYHFK